MRALSLAVLLLAACASTQVCDTLYFGTAKPGGGEVTEAEWRAFVDDTLVVRFPKGFTTWDALGEWRGGRERSHVVFILHPAADDRGIDEIIAAYRKRFAQEAVLRVRGHCNARF